MGQNSLLTKTQREFLNTPPDKRKEKYSKQQRSYHRQNIQERLRAGMTDFSLIIRTLSPNQIREALEIRDLGEPGEAGDLALEVGAADAIGLIHLAYRDRDLNSTEGDFLAGRIEKGIRRSLNRLGRGVESVDVSIQVEIGDSLDVFGGQSADELAEYSVNELTQAMSADQITTEQFMAALEEKGLTLPDE